MAECSHDCASCSQKCSKESLLAPQNKASNGTSEWQGPSGSTLLLKARRVWFP